MKRHILPLVILGLISAVLILSAFDNFPRVSAVEPESGKAGDIASAKGENLDKTKIGEIYLTDGKTDVKMSITEQTDTEIKFKVPAAKAGRYHILVLTANKASMIEQPVVFTVE